MDCVFGTYLTKILVKLYISIIFSISIDKHKLLLTDLREF